MASSSMNSTSADLQKIAEGLKVLTAHVLEQKSQISNGQTREPAERRPNAACLWCDSKEHTRNDCHELTEALRERWVKFVGEPGKKRLAYFDNSEEIPLNFGKGGMKNLVEKHQGKVKVGAMQYEPRVFKVEERDFEKACNLSFGYDNEREKRYAEYIQRQTGWDAPVCLTTLGSRRYDLDVVVDMKRNLDFKNASTKGSEIEMESKGEHGSISNSEQEKVEEEEEEDLI